jgi:hypothetical protein
MSEHWGRLLCNMEWSSIEAAPVAIDSYLGISKCTWGMHRHRQTCE